MAEYWKSTPSYWCKFCSQYVRETPGERKNHEASAKHHNNIQRNLRELHKSQERERRDKQAAKNEVARLNGMFGAGTDSANPPFRPAIPKTAPRVAPLASAAQRKAHAEQLAALGVELPEELKQEVTGVGSYKVVSERHVTPSQTGVVTVNRSLADILAESKSNADPITKEASVEGLEDNITNTRKRNAVDDDDETGVEAEKKWTGWGSHIKSYPGSKHDGDNHDLHELLDGISKKKTDPGGVKTEGDSSDSKTLADVPVADKATSAVVFKKRKSKK